MKLPYIVTKEPHTTDRFVVWNLRGKRCLKLATRDEVIDFLIDEDEDAVRDPLGNLVSFEDEARLMTERYGLPAALDLAGDR